LFPPPLFEPALAEAFDGLAAGGGFQEFASGDLDALVHTGEAEGCLLGACNRVEGGVRLEAD
jgi:hypothetical protein